MDSKYTTVEDIDYRLPRGLDKSMLLSLAGCDCIRQHHNLIVTGPTGAGRSYLACALGNRACRQGYRVLYFRIARLFRDLAIANADDATANSCTRARSQLLVLDDWGMALLTDERRRDLFEGMEDRYDHRSTLIAVQLPTKHWHETIGDP